MTNEQLETHYVYVLSGKEKTIDGPLITLWEHNFFSSGMAKDYSHEHFFIPIDAWKPIQHDLWEVSTTDRIYRIEGKIINGGRI